MRRFWQDLRKYWRPAQAFRIYKNLPAATVERIYQMIDAGEISASDWDYVIRTARPYPVS